MSTPDARAGAQRPGRTFERARRAVGRRAGFVAGLLVALALVGAGASLFAGRSAAAAGEARFAVSTEVVNADVGPFTATIDPLGDRLGVSGFEPAILRNRVTAAEDAADRVVADPDEITYFNTFREGAFDGATVDVYRLADGAIRRVRRDRVREGGFAASGWFPAIPGGRLVPPDRLSYAHAFDPWNRPDADAWFAVQAVSPDGALSPPSAAVRARSPARIAAQGRGAAVRDLVAAPSRLDARPGGRGAPAAPQGLAARSAGRGGVQLEWRPGPGGPVAGWRVLVSDTPPEAHRGFFLDLEGGAGAEPIRAGDLVIFGRSFRAPRRDEVLADRVWNAVKPRVWLREPALDAWPEEIPGRRVRLVPHPPDTPVAAGGLTYLSVELDRRIPTEIGRVNHGGSEQDWWAALKPEPYVVSVWLRADRPTVAAFRLSGPQAYERAFRPIPLKIGTEWRRHEVRFTPPRAALLGGAVGSMSIRVEGPGRVDVDDFRVRPADRDFLDFTPEARRRLEASGMGALRTHAFVKTDVATYDLEQLTNPAGAIASRRTEGNTLPQTLDALARAGVDPWLQIEPHFSPEEWLGLVEYLAAPFDPARDDPAARPWAAKRHAQGRAEPWTDAFDVIRFEIGNETWNPLFQPWTFPAMTDAATGRRHGPAEVYGLFMEQVVATLRASSYWTPELDRKVVFALGGWRRHAYGAEAAAASPSSEVLATAAYLGGWDVGRGPPDGSLASFAAVMAATPQEIVPAAEAHLAEAARLSRGRPEPLAVGTYEGGPGYVMNGLNGARVTEAEARTQERVMKSRAAGVATLDAFLAQAALGYDLQNFFTFGVGPRWTSHAPWQGGGGATPAWTLLSLFNRVGAGDMLRVETLATPRADLPADGRRRPALPDAPQVVVYASRADDRLTLVVLSRRLPGWPDAGDDGHVPVEIGLPIVSAERLTLHRLTGAYDATNMGDPETVVAESVPLAPPEDPAAFALDAQAGLDARGLPPAQALVYVFEGVRFAE